MPERCASSSIVCKSSMLCDMKIVTYILSYLEDAFSEQSQWAEQAPLPSDHHYSYRYWGRITSPAPPAQHLATCRRDRVWRGNHTRPEQRPAVCVCPPNARSTE